MRNARLLFLGLHFSDSCKFTSNFLFCCLIFIFSFHCLKQFKLNAFITRMVFFKKERKRKRNRPLSTQRNNALFWKNKLSLFLFSNSTHRMLVFTCCVLFSHFISYLSTRLRLEENNRYFFWLSLHKLVPFLSVQAFFKSKDRIFSISVAIIQNFLTLST